MPFAVVQELLITLGGLAFVCLVCAVFVVVAKVVAPRLLGRDDGSTIEE